MIIYILIGGGSSGSADNPVCDVGRVERWGTAIRDNSSSDGIPRALLGTFEARGVHVGQPVGHNTESAGRRFRVV